MPTPVPRPSLTTTLDQRYSQQAVGGAFDVQQVLSPPGVTPPAGETIDAMSLQGSTFQNPNGFLVKMIPQISQLKVIQTNDQQGTSLYVQGLDVTKYSP